MMGSDQIISDVIYNKLCFAYWKKSGQLQLTHIVTCHIIDVTLSAPNAHFALQQLMLTILRFCHLTETLSHD